MSKADQDLELRSTQANLIELLFVLRRHGLHAMNVIVAIDQIAPFEDPALAWLAARNLQEAGMTPGDAVLAALAFRTSQPIISSDGAFERVGVRRVPLGGG